MSELPSPPARDDLRGQVTAFFSTAKIMEDMRRRLGDSKKRILQACAEYGDVQWHREPEPEPEPEPDLFCGPAFLQTHSSFLWRPDGQGSLHPPHIPPTQASKPRSEEDEEASEKLRLEEAEGRLTKANEDLRDLTRDIRKRAIHCLRLVRDILRHPDVAGAWPDERAAIEPMARGLLDEHAFAGTLHALRTALAPLLLFLELGEKDAHEWGTAPEPLDRNDMEGSPERTPLCVQCRAFQPEDAWMAALLATEIDGRSRVANDFNDMLKGNPLAGCVLAECGRGNAVTPENIRDLAQWYRLHGGESGADECLRQANAYLRGNQGRPLLGCALFQISGQTLHILYMEVHPAFHERGVEEAILQRTMSALRDVNTPFLNSALIEVPDQREAQLLRLQKAGFRTAAVLRRGPRKNDVSRVMHYHCTDPRGQMPDFHHIPRSVEFLRSIGPIRLGKKVPTLQEWEKER
jgi:hypothetical protein